MAGKRVLSIEQQILFNKYKTGVFEMFTAAPPETWFISETVAMLLDVSTATLERDRWEGEGIPFVKCGRTVRYTKKAILQFMQSQKVLKKSNGKRGNSKMRVIK